MPRSSHQFAAALLAVFFALPVAAQPATLWADAGRTEFDLSGTGWATVADVRVDAPLHRFAVVEGGLGWAQTAQSFGEVTYVLPSVELQAQLPIGPVRPYVGVGVDAFWAVDQGPLRDAPYTPVRGLSTGAVSVSAGARVDLPLALSVRAGVRIRGTVKEGEDAFAGGTGDLTLGAGYRF